MKDLVVSDMRGLCGGLPRRGQLSGGTPGDQCFVPKHKPQLVAL